MTAARALCAGPGARRALVDGARGEVELVLSAGAYVSLGPSGWLLVTAPTGPFGPLTVSVEGTERLDLRPCAPARVAGTQLVLGDHVVSCERVRVRCAPVAVRLRGPAEALAAAAAAAGAGLPDPPSVLHRGIAGLEAGRDDYAVRWLAGLGDGLTPAGDDVLAGYAAARFALAAPVSVSPAAAERSSPLGLAYLRCAERGELPDVAAGLLSAICRGSVAEARAAIAPLRAWGSSSGPALAWGMNAAVVQLTRGSTERGVGDGWIPIGDLRVQGRGDRRFRRAPRRLVGGAQI